MDQLAEAGRAAFAYAAHHEGETFVALASLQGQALVLWLALVSSSLGVLALDDCDLLWEMQSSAEVKGAYSAPGTVGPERVLSLPYGVAEVLHSQTGRILGYCIAEDLVVADRDPLGTGSSYGRELFGADYAGHIRGYSDPGDAHCHID